MDIKKRIKSFLNNNKKAIILSSVLTGTLLLGISIYFSQTMYFYQMEKVQQTSNNQIDSFDGTSSWIAKKYKRTLAKVIDDPLLKASGKSAKDFYPNNFSTSTLDEETLTKIYQSCTNSEKTGYMDDDYINNAIATNSLKQHPAAKYQYYTYVDNSVLAVQKNFNLDLKTEGYYTTGLFLPPGEILTITFPNMTDDEVKNLNLSVAIGSQEINSNSNGLTRTTKRMPILRKDFSLNKATIKVGTPFGGIVSIINENGQNNDLISKTVAVELSGAVEAVHYIHGKTTEQEWKRLLKEAKAPCFDFRTDSIQFFGSLENLVNKYNGIENLPYPKKSMNLYRKMALNTFKIENYPYTGVQSSINRPLRTIISHYVTNASAAAVSHVPAMFVSASFSWSKSLLDGDDLLKNGSWGIMHEFNHQFQYYNSSGLKQWGFAGGGEVTNNVLSMLSYINYLDVHSNRTEPQKIINAGGHSYKYNPYTAMNNLNNNTTSRTTNGFDTHYSVIFELLGTTLFENLLSSYYNIAIKDYSNNDFSLPTKYANADQNANFVYRLSMLSGYDWSDFYNSYGLLDNKFNSSDSSSQTSYQTLVNDENIKQLEKIHPAYSFYASQVSYSQDNNYKDVARPFGVDSNQSTTLKIEEYTNTNNRLYDLSNFTLVSQPKYGKLTINENNGKKEFIYTPDSNHINDLDEFVYKVTSTQKANQNGSVSDEANTSKVTSSSDVYFKVQLFQKDGNYQWESPSIPNDYVIRQFAKDEIWYPQNIDLKNLEWWEMDSSTNQYKLNTNVTNSLSSMFDSNLETGFESNVTTGQVKLVIPFNKTTTFSDIRIRSRRFVNGYENPTNISVSYYDANNNLHKVLDNVKFDSIINQVFELSEKVTTNKVEIEFFKWNGSQINNNTLFHFNEISFGKKFSPKNIIDPSSNQIVLRGDWRSGFGTGKVNNKTLFTSLPNTKMEFGFNGTWCIINGIKDKNYGSFDVYVDNKYYETVTTSSNEREFDKTLAIISNLSNDNHIVKIVSKSSNPIEITYMTTDGNQIPINVNDWYYFYVVGIPVIAVLLITTITLATLYVIKVRKGKNKINYETKKQKQ